MYDIYLGGAPSQEWRKRFIDEIGPDIKIFDSAGSQHESNLLSLEHSAFAVFYIDEVYQSSCVMLEIGEAVGRGKHVIVCIIGNPAITQSVTSYCEHHGIPTCKSLDDLILMSEEYIGELALIIDHV